MKRTKVFATSLVTLVLLFVSFSTATATEYSSMNDLRDAAHNGWHQTYEAHGRTIQADLEIKFPDTDKAAIVQVGAYTDFVAPADSLDYSNFGDEPGIWINNYIENYTDTYIHDSKKEFLGRVVKEDMQAEDNPLTSDEAIDIAMTLFKSLEKEPLQYECFAVLAFSKAFLDVAGRDGKSPQLDLTEPRTLMGNYRLFFHQVIQGIPVIAAGSLPGILLVRGYNSSRPIATLWVDMNTPDSYAVAYYPVKEERVLNDDIPLLTFGKIKTIFEQYINMGVVREIHRVEFGYMLFDDPSSSGSYILRPIWAMYCDIMEGLDKPNLVRSSDLQVETELTGPIAVFVDAQTGTSYTQFETLGEKNVLPSNVFLSWDDVR